MVKFVLLLRFIMIIFIYNNLIIFFYNLCFFIVFIIIFVYIYKDIVWINISLWIGCEYYSIWLIILRIWIVGLIFLRLEIKGERGLKLVVFIVLLIILVRFFIFIDIILFYLFFEIRIIPTFFLIIYWGLNYERIRAAYYLMIYILIVSFPLLIYLINIYINIIRFKFTLLINRILLYNLNFVRYIIIYGAFFIKMPIYLFHVWLPKAHVEAPVYGSIILAGVLLKIGGYGLIRFIIIFIKRRLKFNYFIFSVRIVGRLLISITCIVQVDMKILVAYSSVVHINMIIGAMLTLFKIGFLGGYIMMVAHGLCSSRLFYIVDIYYKRIGRRLIVLNKGILRKIPSLALWWFLLCIINFSFPLSLNFIREIYILRVIINWDMIIIIYLIVVCFFRCAYSLYLFSYVQHGERSGKDKFIGNLFKEFFVLIIHSWPLILLLLNLLILIYLSSLKKILICGIKVILSNILSYLYFYLFKFYNY